jgi:hypothetical protein
MIRKAKAGGLALLAMFVLGALTASTALAVPQYTASSYPATVTGSNTKGAETITFDGTAQLCDSHFVSGSLNAATSTLTITPTYSNCESFGFLNATFNMEGCTYVFHATEQVAADVYRHHMDVACPTGKSIKVESGTCRWEIKPQTDRTTVETTNLAGGALTLLWNVSLSITVTQDGFGCSLAGTGTRNGTYHGHVVFARVGSGSASVSGS